MRQEPLHADGTQSLPEGRRVGLIIVADESASPDGITRTVLGHLAGGANRTAMLVATSAALVADVRQVVEREGRKASQGYTSSAVAPDLAAAAALVASKPPVLALRLARPRAFLDSLYGAATSIERRAA